MDITITRLSNPAPNAGFAMGNQGRTTAFESKVASPAPRSQEIDLALQQETADRQRRQMVERAATSFAVSDTRFTIFKDTAGQYITRVTSLIDGSVAYYPEPEMLQQVSARQSDFASSFALQA